MTVLTDTQVVTASGGLVELGYSQITSSVNVTATSNAYASATTIIGDTSVVCDGSPVHLEFYTPSAYPNTVVNDYIVFVLYRDAALIALWGQVWADTTALSPQPTTLLYRDTPTAGVHSYTVKAFRNVGTGVVGNSQASGWAPTYLRVSKIVTATQWPAVTTGSIICTSSTRPASPFAGQQIYETDTSKSLIYSGSVWQPPWNTAWGSVAAPATWGNNSITSTSTADTTLASVTFVAVAGRRYRASWIFDTYCGAGYGVSAKVKNGATLIATVAYGTGGVNQNLNLNGNYVISGLSAGSCTINLTGTSTTATMTYYGSVVTGQFAIEDVGPV